MFAYAGSIRNLEDVKDLCQVTQASFVAFLVSHRGSVGSRERRCGCNTKHQSTKAFPEATGRAVPKAEFPPTTTALFVAPVVSPFLWASFFLPTSNLWGGNSLLKVLT